MNDVPACRRAHSDFVFRSRLGIVLCDIDAFIQGKSNNIDRRYHSATMAWEEPRKTGMQYRRLGNSGLHVSVLGLGGWLTYVSIARDMFVC